MVSAPAETTAPTTGSGVPEARLLVVEDERTLAGMVAAYLSQAGFTAELAHRGDDAVAAVRADPPDVVVLDLGLPGMDGIEVCRQIRTFSDCYILILTARGDEVDRPGGCREFVEQVGSAIEATTIRQIGIRAL